MNRLFRLLPAVVVPALTTACVTPVTPNGAINEDYQAVLEKRHNYYTLKPGDVISIKLFNREGDLNQTDVRILDDGRSDVLFLDNYRLVGKTVKEVEEAFREEVVGREALETEISIQVLPSGEVVHLVGEFTRPASVPLTTKMTLNEAISAVGGFRITGDSDWALLRRPYLDPRVPELYRIDLNEDGEEIYLLPGDQVVLGRTFFAGFINYMREYVWALLPSANPFSFASAATF